ncbi:alpha/beta hydrolase [Streptomyces sp. NPDC049555]|uniref:alpha/beta fold hydrolase n=1 Tax=Streptomyces sp. NPDC049555 TaxID=3154930 RepID=UPI003421B888
MPMEQGFFSTGLPYLAFGTGTPLVYLSDFTMTHTVPRPGAQRVAAARLVRPFVSAGYRVFWTNRRPGMVPGTTMGEIAGEHAAALREEFGRPVPVVAHGTGGSVALQLAVDHPTGVISRLVLAGAAHALGPVGRRFHRDMLAAAERGRSAMHRAAPAITRDPLLRRLLVVPLWIAGRFDRPPADHSDMKAMLLAEDAFDVHDRLHRVAVPVLVVWGARDHLWPTEMFRQTADAIPGAKGIEYQRAGHSVVSRADFFRDATAFLKAA